MEKPFDPNEFISNSRLAEIRMIFDGRQIPDELLPKTKEDQAAIFALQSKVWPIDESLVSANAQRLEQRLPLRRLCAYMAMELLPFIRRAYRKTLGDAANLRRDPHSELRTLSSFIQFTIHAENPEFVTRDKIYQMLSRQQLWMIHLWPSSAKPDFAASGELILKWLDGTFLVVAITFQAHMLLECVSPNEFPRKGLEWLLGYEPCPDWYFVTELKKPQKKPQIADGVFDGVDPSASYRARGYAALLRHESRRSANVICGG